MNHSICWSALRIQPASRVCVWAQHYPPQHIFRRAFTETCCRLADNHGLQEDLLLFIAWKNTTNSNKINRTNKDLQKIPKCFDIFALKKIKKIIKVLSLQFPVVVLLCVSKETTLLRGFFTHLQTLRWKPIPKPRRQVLEAFRFVVKGVLKGGKQSFLLTTDTIEPRTVSFVAYGSTHRGDVGLHGQQVEESEELNGEDGVNLSGGQHQHSQREQHLEIRSVPPPLRRSVINIHNFKDKRPHTAACTRSCVHVCCCHT